MNAISLTLKIVGVILIAVIVAIVGIMAIVDPNDYRDEITELVKKETGRDLNIESLSLSFFPHFGLELENTTLSNAKGFSEKDFLHIDTIQLGAAILPLLSQKLEVDTLTVHGLTLHLEKNAQGITNWADLIQSDSPSEEEKEAHTDEYKNPLDALANLKFDGLDIQQGTIHWHDQQANQDIQLTLHNFSTGTITFGKFFNLALSAESTLSTPKIKTAFELNLEAKLEKSGAYAVRNLTLNSVLTSDDIPVKNITQTLSIPTLNLTAKNNQLSLPSLTLNYDVIGGGENFPLQTIKGQLQVDALTGHLTTQAFDAKTVTLQSHLTGDALPNGELTTSLSMQPSINLTTEKAHLNQLVLNILGMDIKGFIKATNITSSAQVNTRLNIEQTNLKALLTELNIALPEMPDPQALTQFMATFDINFKAQTEAIQFNTLQITLDDSQLSGNASIRQFDQPNIQYNLSLNTLDLNRYFSPPKEQPKSPAPSSSEEVEITLPVEFLQKLTLNGTLKVGSLTFDKLHPKNIVVTLKGKEGHIIANPIKLDIFNTNVQAQAGVDVRNNQQKFSFKLNSQNIPIGEALMAIASIDKLGGTGSIDLNIHTAGSNITQFKHNLNGTVSTHLTHGFIKGFNLAQSIREAQAKLANKAIPPNKEALQTDFSSLTAQANIKNGVITTQTLTAQAPFMRLSGSGKIDLPNESLNYLVRTKIVATDKGQGGEDFQSLNGLTLPIKLKGSYLSPKVSLDISGILAEKTKAELEQKKTQLIQENKAKLEQQKETIMKETKEKVDQQIKEQLDGLLKGLPF